MTHTSLHPDPTAIEGAVNAIRNLARNSPSPYLEMGSSIIHTRPCNTVACFAGWHLLATLRKSGTPTRLGRDYVLTNPANGIPFGYGLGARRFAQDVGFESAPKLKVWAADNPGAWGNSHGFDLFEDLYAFYPDRGLPPEDGRTDLDLVLDHWLGVARRIRQLAGSLEAP